MRTFIYLLLVGNVVANSFFALVHDTEGDMNCRVLSQANHGCSGYSAIFANRKGKDCSDLINTGTNEELVKVDICGTEDGKQVAWVTVNKNGRVTFLNRQGETSSCILENGLQIPSSCSLDSSISSQPLTSTFTGVQSSVLASTGKSASPILSTGKSSIKTLNLIPTDYQTLVATSTRESTRETSLAENSLKSTSRPTYTCACPASV